MGEQIEQQSSESIVKLFLSSWDFYFIFYVNFDIDYFISF